MLFYKCILIILFILIILYYYNTKNNTQIKTKYNYQNMYNFDNSHPKSILKKNNIKSNKRVYFIF